MRNIIIYLIVRKYAKRAGLKEFNKIPYKVVFEAIKRAKKDYQKGNEESFILLIAKNSFVNYFKLRNKAV
jgi:hypothetical protein